MWCYPQTQTKLFAAHQVRCQGVQRSLFHRTHSPMDTSTGCAAAVAVAHTHTEAMQTVEEETIDEMASTVASREKGR